MNERIGEVRLNHFGTANEYCKVIPNKLYRALLEYEVRICIDKNYAT